MNVFIFSSLFNIIRSLGQRLLGRWVGVCWSVGRWVGGFNISLLSNKSQFKKLCYTVLNSLYCHIGKRIIDDKAHTTLHKK